MHRVFMLLLLASISLFAAPVDGGVARVPDLPSYDVELSGSADGTTWSGRVTVAFTNTSDEPLPEIYLRLWGNVHDCKAVVVRIGESTGDCTVVKVPLAEPLAPGKRTSVAFDATMTAPNRLDRFGRSGTYSFFGNALPVLAVRDNTGWHLEPDVGIGESFYTVAADFRVRLTHTGNLVVPATGVTTGVTTDGVTIAKQVRDFAWAAGPFTMSEATSPGGTKIRTWATSTVALAAVVDARTKAMTALDDFGRRFGAYPYGEFDLVLNDRWTKFSGMEYPGFVLLISPASPVVHEVAHQWWYGIIGNNEYADPWLDEAFATYATDLHEGNHRPACWPRSLPTAITSPMSYWQAHQASYGAVVYTYGACMLHDLERLIGTPAMAGLLTTYAKAHWHGVSTPADFKAAAQAASGTDLTSFWRSHAMG
ncbi:peptidase M1-like protein [Kribbella steppae]|uniref:Peptidase M1-like protein n=1 Tax=Kribbella steppae TaxID=2512223 RepID=A0A4R2HQT2_9ACTN|nr:M1 family metallopeptidase [Kribbella steppae]TCO33554.1 peptidase M1-like protein [Kribbella steppae]